MLFGGVRLFNYKHVLCVSVKTMWVWCLKIYFQLHINYNKMKTVDYYLCLEGAVSSVQKSMLYERGQKKVKFSFEKLIYMLVCKQK